MRIAHLPGFACLVFLIWSCSPLTPVYTPYFDPAPAASPINIPSPEMTPYDIRPKGVRRSIGNRT